MENVKTDVLTLMDRLIGSLEEIGCDFETIAFVEFVAKEIWNLGYEKGREDALVEAVKLIPNSGQKIETGGKNE